MCVRKWGGEGTGDNPTVGQKGNASLLMAQAFCSPFGHICTQLNYKMDRVR